MKIHLYDDGEYRKIYFFTKSKNRCLKVEYDPTWDFGKHSTSGAKLDEVKIHYKNSYIFSPDYKEITIDEVPESIKDILSYLS